MKKQSIYFLVIIILLVQTSCQQNNEEEDFFNNQITLLENNPRLYLSKIDSTQVTNLNNSKEATHFLLVSLANYYVNNYYPPKEVLQKSIHIFTKKKLIQQQLESLLFLAKTYKKEKNLKMEVQAIEKAIDIASQIEDKEWLCCLYGYLGDMYIRKYNMLKFIKYQTLANQCIEDIAFRDMDISTQVQTAKSFLYIGNHKKSYELLNLIESSIDKNNIYYNEIKCLQGITLFMAVMNEQQKIQYIAHTISPTILNSIITNVFSFFLNTCQRSTEYLSRAKGKKYRTSEASTGDFLPGE